MSFLLPYFAFLYGAAYSIQQILEGAGLASSNFIELDSEGMVSASFWSPQEAALQIFAFLLFYTMLLTIGLLLAGFVLARWYGLIGVLIILAVPGILSILGCWPEINYLPEFYQIGGGGVLGHPLGLLPLLILGLTTGWCITVIVYDTFNFDDRFRGYYDHLWYATALLAGLFFVADSIGNRHMTKLSEENRVSRDASLYLLGQVREYAQVCEIEDKTDMLSCKWASDVQQRLNKYASYGASIYHLSGPVNSAEIYAGFRSTVSEMEVFKIREEIELYNQAVCPSEEFSSGTIRYAKPSQTCQRVPLPFCTSFPDPPAGLVERNISIRSFALASECVIPTLVASREKQESLNEKLTARYMEQYKRWWAFIALAAVAGGKIANSTTKTFNLDKRGVHDRRRLIRLVQRLLAILRVKVCSFIKTLGRLLN